MKKLRSQKVAYEKGRKLQYTKAVELGPIISYSLQHDPIHMAFVLSRYKFVSKMLTNKKHVLEVGCGDAFGIPIVAQFVESLTGIDSDAELIKDNKRRLPFLKNVTFQAGDFFEMDMPHNFDAMYAIDVLEHFDPSDSPVFFQKVSQLLVPNGMCIIGTPNKTASSYSAPQSEMQHLNLQTHDSLQQFLSEYFETVLLFSMNDEVIHTGFSPMAHYLWGIGVGVKKKA